MADAAKASTIPEALEIIRADTVKTERIDWWWRGRFAFGKLGILAGMPERGKGLAIADIFARISKGLPWPCGEGRAEIGDCVLLQQEDDIGDTVVPRLQAAGADLSHVHILTMIKKEDGSGQRMFNIATDLAMLKDVLKDIPDPQLLAIDPLTAYVGKINASSGNDVRAALMPLVELLREFHIGGLGVMHFNKKVEIDNALARVADSLAFGRHCFVVTDDPENNRKLFVKAKNNLAPDIKALSFTTELVRHASIDHRDGGTIEAPRLVWGYEHVEISATQAMRAEVDGTAARNPRKEAKDFLLKILTENGGSMLQKDVEDHAGGEGISLITLRRAKTELGVISKKQGMGGGWVWSLPGKAEDKNEF
jgi:putative DNA primase/helicase